MNAGRSIRLLLAAVFSLLVFAGAAPVRAQDQPQRASDNGQASSGQQGQSGVTQHSSAPSSEVAGQPAKETWWDENEWWILGLFLGVFLGVLASLVHLHLRFFQLQSLHVLYTNPWSILKMGWAGMLGALVDCAIAWPLHQWHVSHWLAHPMIVYGPHAASGAFTYFFPGFALSRIVPEKIEKRDSTIGEVPGLRDVPIDNYVDKQILRYCSDDLHRVARELRNSSWALIQSAGRQLARERSMMGIISAQEAEEVEKYLGGFAPVEDVYKDRDNRMSALCQLIIWFGYRSVALHIRELEEDLKQT